MTVNDFADLATGAEMQIYSLSKAETLWSGYTDDINEIDEEDILYEEVVSYDIENNTIIFNIE